MEELKGSQLDVLEACWSIVKEDSPDSLIIMQGQYDFVARRTNGLSSDQVKYAMGDLSKKGLLVFDEGDSYPAKGWYLTEQGQEYFAGQDGTCPHCQAPLEVEYRETTRDVVRAQWNERAGGWNETIVDTKLYERNETGNCLDCGKRVKLADIGL